MYPETMMPEYLPKPRETARDKGIENVQDQDLISLIIGSGTRSHPVTKLSRYVLKQAGSLQGLYSWNLDQWQTVPGLGLANATRLKAAFELHTRLLPDTNYTYIKTSDDVYQEVVELGQKQQEHLVALYLNARQQLIHKQTIAIGSLNATFVQPRAIFGPALIQPCFGVIFCHNHPSGDSTPSQEDLDMTRRIVEAGSILGIQVLDHLVVTSSGYFSFLKEGLLKSRHAE